MQPGVVHTCICTLLSVKVVCEPEAVGAGEESLARLTG
jgi:hypothetical protein